MTIRVSTIWEGRRVSSKVPADTSSRVLGGRQNLETVRSRSYKRLYTHGHTDTHTHTHAHKAINIIVIAGPAVFRGRLRAFGKCTNGVAFSKGRPNLAIVRLTLEEKQYFTSVLMSIPLGTHA